MAIRALEEGASVECPYPSLKLAVLLEFVHIAVRRVMSAD